MPKIPDVALVDPISRWGVLNTLKTSSVARARRPSTRTDFWRVILRLRNFGLLANSAIGANPTSVRSRLASAVDSSRALLRE